MVDLAKNNEVNRQKCLDSIRFWLNSITVYTYDESVKIAASIIVIGTRKDEVKDAAEHQRISDILNEEFESILAWESIIKSTEGNYNELIFFQSYILHNNDNNHTLITFNLSFCLNVQR